MQKQLKGTNAEGSLRRRMRKSVRGDERKKTVQKAECEKQFKATNAKSSSMGQVRKEVRRVKSKLRKAVEMQGVECKKKLMGTNE